MFREAARASFQAADIWIKYYKKYEEPDEIQAELDEQVFKILRTMRKAGKIAAIKEVRTTTGMTLREAKEHVESLNKKFEGVNIDELDCDATIKRMF